MAITRTQIARQLYRIGGVGGRAEEGSVERPGGDEGGRNPMAQFQKIQPGIGGPNTEGLTFMDEARKKVNPFGILTELPGVTGFLANAFTPNPFMPKTKRVNPFVGGVEDASTNLPTWAKLGFSSEAEYLASLQEQNNMDQETEVAEEDSSLKRRFAASGGVMGGLADGNFDFENARQMYGLGKLVKKVTRSVKKIAKSPIGKAALLYTGLGGFGNMAVGQSFFSNFANPSAFLGGAKNIFSTQGLKNIAFGTPGKYLGSPRGPNTGILTKGTSGLFGVGGELSPLKAISAVSAVSGLLTPEQEEEAQNIADETGIDIEEIRANPNKYLARRFRAEGGSMKEPVAKKTMPLLDMGGKEMDLRAEGGFVPIGRMEKADDVPARLSKNEFVFTADAVRNAGEGDVDKGAEVMYNMMKNLESGGDVSEESQGLEGARKMFQTSQRLEEVL